MIPWWQHFFMDPAQMPMMANLYLWTSWYDTGISSIVMHLPSTFLVFPGKTARHGKSTSTPVDCKHLNKFTMRGCSNVLQEKKQLLTHMANCHTSLEYTKQLQFSNLSKNTCLHHTTWNRSGIWMTMINGIINSLMIRRCRRICTKANF